MKRYFAKIKGLGHYSPENIVENSYFVDLLNTSEEWINKMTGIKRRHFAPKEECTSNLAHRAAKMALANADLKAKDLDLIIIATVTPDRIFPSTACIVQNYFGVNGFPCFDISAGCSGFIYASDIAKQYIENGTAKNVLVIGAENLSKITNFQDRNTAMLFGDGAGAVIYSRAEETDISRVIDSYLEADGAGNDLLFQEAGGSRLPASKETVEKKLHTLSMEGNKIFKLAVKSMQKACDTIAKRNHLDYYDLDWLVPHQANLRIIESLGNKLKIDKKKVIVNIQEYANTSSATIPFALSEAVSNNIVRKSDLVMLVAFGAGLTSGSLLIRM